MEIIKAKNIKLTNKGLAGFLIIYGVFLFVGILLLLNMNHGDVVLWINRYSKEEWDASVNLLTDLGLGSFVSVVMILLAFLQLRYALMGLFNLALVGLFTNLFKKILFAERVRPFNYFLYDDFTRFLYEAELNYHSSFPSGHTMTIFAAMSLIAWFIGKKAWGFSLFFIALAIGFTRIYLLQHFFLDVFVGSVLGVLSTLITIWLANNKLGLDKREIFQKPLYKISFLKS